MDKLTEFLIKPFLTEGVRDPGIFKAIFLAGGPGSGKSYVAKQLFGIPEKINVSKTGLKMVNQDTELEMLLTKYFGTVDLDNMPTDLFKQLTDPKYDDYSGLRAYAKSLSKERLRLYTEGRLGVIIDGTGHKFKSVKEKRKKLMDMGYDTYMVFVNTSLEIAMKRNEERARALPADIVRKSWQDVQGNLAFFQGLFGASNFLIVDNNKFLSAAQAEKKFSMLVNQGLTKFLKKPPKNKIAKDWIKKQQHIKKIDLPNLMKKVKMAESIKLPVEIGDTILMGRFKNKKVVVKSIDYNDNGDLLINGRPALKFRIMESINESEVKTIYSLLQKYGNSEKDAKNMIRKNYKKVSKKFRGQSVRDKAMALIGISLLGESMTKSQIKSMRDKFKKTGELPPHLKKFVKAKKEFEKKFKVKNIVVPGLEWMSDLKEAPRVPRKKGQHRGSKSHSDLYTDENPKGTIHGLKFATVKDAQASVRKIKSSSRSHAHKIQAAVAMEQRAREMGKTSQAAVYRAYINKMKKKTKKKNEEFGAPAGMLPSPSRKMVKKMKRKGNTSVPYGSGYKKIQEFINKPKMKSALQKLVDKNLIPKIYTKNISKLQIYLTNNPVVMTQLLRLLGENINENDKVQLMKLYNKAFKMMPNSPAQKKVRKQIDALRKKLKMNEETSKIKKVIGVFGGRFQPFHPGHLATYKWLASKVDEAYITTSNIKQPPRHPMDFKEKVRHMVKMGIPKNRIIQEKTPYVAVNLLKKFNADTTAVVYAFGQKDAGRLKGGTKKDGSKTYYQDFNQNKNNLQGYETHGYILTAPQQGNLSGTKMRDLLGNPKYSDDERQKTFKKTFKYFDKGIYNMMTNKFKKLFETIDISEDLIKEFLLEYSDSLKGNLDDGPSTYYQTLNAYEKTSKEWLDSIYKKEGWKVVDYAVRNNIIKPEENVAKAVEDHTRRKPGQKHYNSVPLTYMDHGTQGGSNTAVNKYKKHLDDVVGPIGWQVVDWMGTSAAIDNIIGSVFAAGASAEIDKSFLDTIDLDNIEFLEEKTFSKEWWKKELMLEGGAYGHLNHPFDDKKLTFSDFKKLIINTLQGKLDKEGPVTEKTDGQNIMISWKNDKLIAARNKGHIKNFGANALDANGIKNMFSGRGDIEKAFVTAMNDLTKALKGLSKKQKDKIFGEGKRFMSLEVMYPATSNVIPYDKSLLQFHGTIEYDEFGSPIGENRESARVLAGMIKQINQDIQKTYTITKPFVANLPQVKDFSKRQSYFLGKLKKLQSEYKLKDTDTLADYHQAYWMEYIYNGGKQTDYKHPDNRILMKLTKRWAFFDKSYKIPQIRKDLEKYPKFLDWVLSTDKMNHAKLQKEHIRDWEVLFFELGAEILKNMSDFIAANPSEAAQKIRKDLVGTINKVKKSKDPKVLNTLKVQLDRLKALGGLDAVVPSEGVTFVYKGKLYKYTGAFAPANQILGMLKFV